MSDGATPLPTAWRYPLPTASTWATALPAAPAPWPPPSTSAATARLPR